MEKNRCVIIGGADIRDYKNAAKYLKASDYCIFCDSGLKHMQKLEMKPDLIVGDFDSYENPHMDVETIVLPCEKDDTDTFFAVKEGIRRGFDVFLLLGIIGGRLDHTLGNLSILLYLDSLGKQAVALDDYSQMEIISSEPKQIEDDCSYFSLLNISGRAEGVSVENAKYPVQNGSITCEYAYGVSNEVLPGKTATVSVKEGKLLLVRVFSNE